MTDARLLLPKLTSLRSDTTLGPWIAFLLQSQDVQVTLFGSFQVRQDGRTWPLKLRKSREMLAYLLLHGPSTRSQLISALWPQVTEQTTEYFKQALKLLRADLKRITTDGQNIEVQVVGGLYRVSGDIQWTTSVDPRPVFSKAKLRSVGLPEVGTFLADFDSPWVEDARLSMQALLATLLLREPATDDAGLQRLRELRHLLPDDDGVLVALKMALLEAGAEGEAAATQITSDIDRKRLGD